MTSTSKFGNKGNKMKKKMSKEELQLALTKKKQCDARALSIVERLIENPVDEKWLLENLEHVNRCHMDDIVEERAILKRCGYPLCDNVLKVNIVQQYHISTRSNKVYDVSRRKNFCSNNCYGATNYILEQMFTSPLWLRDPKEKPNFHLLPVGGLSKNSTPGDEVDLGREYIIIDTNKKPESSESKDTNKSCRKEDNPVQNDIFNKYNDFTSERDHDRFEEKLTIERREVSVPEKTVAVERSKIDKPVIERDVKLEQNSIPKLSSNENKKRERRVKKNATPDKLDSSWLVQRIECYLQEWITLDSLILLLGDTALKQQKINEIAKMTKDGELNKKYVQLCQKVDSLQIDGDSEDEESKADLKPLPDYSALKEEGKKLEIKVNAFFKGRTDIEMPRNDKATDEKDDSSTIFPPRPEHEPKTLRRRIILEKLDKVLPEMVQTLAGGDFIIKGCIATSGCGETVKALVNTFSLSAQNVIPKPAEWNLLGLIFIKLLSISEPRLRFLLGTDRAIKYTTMILMSYNLEPNYLDSVVARLTVVESYSDKNSTGNINITVS